MKRRKFLVNALFGLPLSFSPLLLVGCDKDKLIIPNGKKVIVVGAGIAGISAAKRLRENGFEVLILESQDKIGGRIRTNRSLNLPFEEGASWIHTPKGNPITNVAKQSGATTFLTSDDSVEVFDIDGTKYTNSALTKADNQYYRAIEAVKNAGSKDKSFQEVFDTLYPSYSSNRLWTFILSSYLEFDTGADISMLSSKYFYDDEEYKGEDVIVTNGYDRITDFLAQKIDVQLNSRVVSIDYSGVKVVVNTDSNTFEADYIIVAVPLGVLKNKSIDFEPSLPMSKTKAINSTNMGTVNKFLLVWDEPFWDVSLQYIGYTPETKGKFNYFLNTRKYSSTNGLMTFAFGDYAIETENMTDGEVIEEIMLHLKSIYGNEIPNPTSFLRTKWAQNVNSFGSYSYATVNTTSEDFNILSNQIDNKLFFAGEHTSKDYVATVHGAYLSGIREANKLIDLL